MRRVTGYKEALRLLLHNVLILMVFSQGKLIISKMKVLLVLLIYFLMNKMTPFGIFVLR